MTFAAHVRAAFRLAGLRFAVGIDAGGFHPRNNGTRLGFHPESRTGLWL